jgi:hypothetical protein
MLAQAANNAVDSLAVAFAAVLAMAVPIAAACTKGTDFIRNLVGVFTVPKWVWNVVPLVLGVLLCWGFKLNAVAPLASSVPALVKSSTLSGTTGEILTGLFSGAIAGFWHDKLSMYPKSGGRQSGKAAQS